MNDKLDESLSGHMDRFGGVRVKRPSQTDSGPAIPSVRPPVAKEEGTDSQVMETSKFQDEDILPVAAIGTQARRSAENAVKSWEPDEGIDGRHVIALRNVAIQTRLLHRINGFVIVSIGQELNRAKELIGHGNFGRYVEEACGLSHRTANNYMKAAARFHDARKIANFAPATIYKLSSAKVTTEQVNEIVEKAENDAEALKKLKSLLDPQENDESPQDAFNEFRKLVERVKNVELLTEVLPQDKRDEIRETLKKLQEQVLAAISGNGGSAPVPPGGA